MDEPLNHASHVEITFRDEYLTRADMWRLAVATLINKNIYKGQRILFLGTIRALVKTIFVQGKKVECGFFGPTTKPIFRSESARYVIFVQMSKEMWDFDADGSGEIMFSKVINGFLPELFKRWRQIGVKHLLSIVLFTRVEYERGLSLIRSQVNLGDLSLQNAVREGSHQDFYRVVVSDLGSGQWANILAQLKAEFKTFLRDVSTRRPETDQVLSLGTGLTAATADCPLFIISGRPSIAMRGNILEAINLASSQFSCDHIDRDLVRTGVSIVVITPGTGLFEVDHQLLIKTTESLIENGVGIDLVCLSRMPLHSVPLFKYWQWPSRSRDSQDQWDYTKELEHSNLSLNIFRSNLNQGSILSSSFPDSDSSSQFNNSRRSVGNWRYGIPNWIDVSFWTSSSNEDRTQAAILGKIIKKGNPTQPQQKAFVPRVKMYELQMMGAMEAAMSDISLPHMSPYGFHMSNEHLSTLFQKDVDVQKKSSSHQAQKDIMLEAGMDTNSTVTGASMASINQAVIRDFLHSYNLMDEYDEMVFRHPKQRLAAERKVRKAHSSSSALGHRRDYSSLVSASLSSNNSSPTAIKHEPEDKTSFDRLMEMKFPMQVGVQKRGSISSTISSSNASLVKPARLSRQISFGPRGFSSGALKASASTELSAEHAKFASSLSRGHKARSLGKARKVNPAIPNRATSTRRLSNTVSTDHSTSQHVKTTNIDPKSQRPSRPITIRTSTVIHAVEHKDQKLDISEVKSNSDDNTTLKVPVSCEHLLSSPGLPALTDSYDFPKTLSSGDSMTPWLTILNPSNPHKMNISMTSRLGRWQHIFPHPLRTSKIKWKSLCSPAAIPLTTEDFPSSDQIITEYEESQYRVVPLEYDESIDQHRSRDWLLKEMIAFRFSQGFQVVVGPKFVQSLNLITYKSVHVFQDLYPVSAGSTMVMSRGGIFHQLSYIEGGEINVRCFIRRDMYASSFGVHEEKSKLYKPAIRTMFAEEYNSREIDILSPRNEINWETIDSFLSGDVSQQAELLANNIRSWRARFVLIPMDPPCSGRRPLHQATEDNEEEIRLEGIRKLTQIWQRFRYIPANERQFQATVRRREDTNPLDIMYQTRNPSVIVAAEIDSIGELNSSARPIELLPESDLYQRSTLNLASLAQVIQSEKGVRMMDRRWHWRLHYNCFIGFELTSWILQNFRDIETREEAVDLGNELMKRKLFQHVEQRHNFRDGNFFYQIASEYRASRPEPNRNWFGNRKVDKSVPSTPLSDGKTESSPKLPRSRAGSISENQDDSEPSTPTGGKQRLRVALSKSLLYDVDRRKRSQKPEVVHLHYDRLHNPDNCYHIRIDWMNVTAKFIEDAVVFWAATVDRFGLRLVEVPLGEAVSITEMHPFRAPILVKLAQDPPEKQPRSYIDATSFSVQERAERHFYQKVILKRFNFVLDFEAAKDFPSDVEVTYSWGKPNYRYPQYVHRSGVLIAQITDEGDFLLLPNRLYNNRGARDKVSERMEDVEGSGGSVRYDPARSTHHRASPHSSPCSSPSVRASEDVPNPTSGFARLSQTSTSASPEQIKQEFEAFCQDAGALDHFYGQVLSKSSSPGPNTPFMEGSIPTLGLPPSLALPAGSLTMSSNETLSSPAQELLSMKISPHPSPSKPSTSEQNSTLPTSTEM